MECILVLHNIRSTYNVGSIFRTADAAGVSRIILCGYTPSPIDRFGRERKDLTKVSLGAEKTIPWQQEKMIGAALKKLKKEGFIVVAIEQDKNSTLLFDYRVKKRDKLALVLGNEVRGLLKQTLALCDHILEIPMRGAMLRQAHHPRHARRGKESLNVSVAAGIVLFTLLHNSWSAQ